MRLYGRGTRHYTLQEPSIRAEVLSGREVTLSVVIPVHNNGRLALRALSSVLRQKRRVDEVVIVDDASNAPTRAFLSRAISRCRAPVPIRIEYLDVNVGPGVARHIGAGIAQGDYIAFLDADDRWHQSKSAVAESVILRSGADLLGHNRPWSFSVSSSELTDLAPSMQLHELTRFSFLARNPIPTSSIVASRDIAKTMFRFGGRKAEDYMALVLASGVARRAVYIDADLCWAPKPPFGYSGEGADQLRIYSSSFAHMLSLRRERLVTTPELAIFTLFLLMKVPIGMLRLWRYRLTFRSRRIG